MGGLRKIYKALRSEQMLQKEALKILTAFSKNGTPPLHSPSPLLPPSPPLFRSTFYLYIFSDKGRECILITKGSKYLLNVLKPELIIEAPPQNIRNSYPQCNMLFFYLQFNLSCCLLHSFLILSFIVFRYMRSSTRGTVNCILSHKSNCGLFYSSLI